MEIIASTVTVSLTREELYILWSILGNQTDDDLREMEFTDQQIKLSDSLYKTLHELQEGSK